MLLFLDTEYTGFGQQVPGLISLGLVAEDGRREFYVELTDTWRVEDCTRFVVQEVLPLLHGPALPAREARQSLLDWLSQAPRWVQLACDSVTDFRLVIDLIGKPLPANLASTHYDLRPLVDTTSYDRAVSEYYRTDNRVHHALSDARAYRKAWLAWMDARKTR